jgi:acyl-CoA thioester hydrolase
MMPALCRSHVEVGLKVAKIGNSSVTYAIGVFTKGEPDPSALGHFVHVYVDGIGLPCPIPQNVRQVLEVLNVEETTPET